MEEISLKEVLLIALNGRRLIALCMAGCMVIGLLAGLILPRKYKATVSVLATPITGAEGLPSMGMPTYLEQLRGEVLMNMVVDDLELKDAEGLPITPTSVADMIEAENPEGTDIITLEVTAKTPEEAYAIAESVSRNFLAYILNLNRTNAQNLLTLFDSQMAAEEERLNETSAALTEYIKNEKSIEVLENERDSILSSIKAYKEQIVDRQKNIVTAEEALRRIYDNNPVEDISVGGMELDVLLENADELSDEIQLRLNNSNKLQDAMLTMEITDLKLTLIKEIEEEKALTDKITELEANLQDVQTQIAQNRHVYSAIEQDYALSEASYTALQGRYKAVSLIMSQSIDSLNIRVIQPARASTVPISVSIAIAVLASAAVGFFIGVFAVFFRHYWAEEDMAEKVE